MTDLITTLRHNQCRSSEALQSYLRSSSNLKLQLTDLQAKLEATERDLKNKSGSKTDA